MPDYNDSSRIFIGGEENFSQVMTSVEAAGYLKMHVKTVCRLAKEGKSLPILEGSDESANRSYIKNIVLDIDSQRIRGVPSDKEPGAPYGLEWAEGFHYIGPVKSKLEEYIKSQIMD